MAKQMREAGTPLRFLRFDDDHVITPEVRDAVAGLLVRGLQFSPGDEYQAAPPDGRER